MITEVRKLKEIPPRRPRRSNQIGKRKVFFVAKRRKCLEEDRVITWVRGC